MNTKVETPNGGSLSEQKIHVCIVSYFPPSKGPLSEYSYHLVKNLAADPRTSKITVLADRIKEKYKEICIDKKVEIIRSWNMDSITVPFSIVRNAYRVNADIIYFGLILRYISSNRFKNLIGLCSPYITKILGIPIVITLHGGIPEINNLEDVGYKNSYINMLGLKLAMKIVLMAADFVTVTHPRFVDTLRTKYNGKRGVLYIPHGTLNSPLSHCDYYGKRLLFFGKVGKYKNLELALEAFRDLVKDNRDAELVIAGSSNPLQPDLKQSILQRYKSIPNVVTREYVAEEELQDLFISCVAVILPYSASTWSSGVFTLASTYGRPVIASDLPDFIELRNEGAGIILFPTQDKAALTKAMDLIVNNRELQKNLGEANLNWARRHSSIEVARRIVDVFDAVSKKRKTSLKIK
jgi:glycosyltransferase involved in cell wall biosynthesis